MTAPGQNSATDPRWQLLANRDGAADGSFVYAVRSTGVFCRPSCAARRPNPANVRFFATCAAAVQAGFRACLRCRPDQTVPLQPHAARIEAACRTLQQAETLPDLAALAAASGLGRSHFHRVFTQALGVTPGAYARALRADRVKQGLARGAGVTTAIYEAGFNAGSRFYEGAGDILGMKPAAYGAGGQGAQIRFAIGACSLGAILVAATARGICAIDLGDDAETLLRDLQARLPRAEFLGGDAVFDAMVSAVIDLVEAPGLGLGLALEVRGTAFQHRVWQALRAIPAGQTASYAQIAARIGAPAAARAVAGACAANPVAVAIPCHRVVRTGGALSGYRWGIARKRALLAREG